MISSRANKRVRYFAIATLLLRLETPSLANPVSFDVLSQAIALPHSLQSMASDQT